MSGGCVLNKELDAGSCYYYLWPALWREEILAEMIRVRSHTQLTGHLPFYRLEIAVNAPCPQSTGTSSTAPSYTRAD